MATDRGLLAHVFMLYGIRDTSNPWQCRTKCIILFDSYTVIFSPQETIFVSYGYPTVHCWFMTNPKRMEIFMHSYFLGLDNMFKKWSLTWNKNYVKENVEKQNRNELLYFKACIYLSKLNCVSLIHTGQKVESQYFRISYY